MQRRRNPYAEYVGANYARVRREILNEIRDDNIEIPQVELRNLVMRRLAQYYRGGAPSIATGSRLRQPRSEDGDDNESHNPEQSWNVDQDDDN